MKKNIIISVIIAIVAIVSSGRTQAQTITELMSREKIAQNRVESISQWTHQLIKDKVSPKGYKSVETTFDKHGNAIEVVNYRQNGQIATRHIYKYDKDNRKIEYIQYQNYRDKGMEVSYRQVFKYDSNGNKLNEIGFDGRTTYRIIYSYTPDGKQKEIVKYDASNNVEEKWIFQYSGNNVEISVFKPAGTLNRKIIRVMDNAGRIVDEKNITPSNKELGRTKFSFDHNNQLLTKTEYHGGEHRAEYEYKYDSRNQLIEVYLTKAGSKKILYSTYRYDNQGNLLEEKWFEDGASDYSRRNYKLDKRGIIDEVDAYYSDYNYRVLYRYEYKFH